LQQKSQALASFALSEFNARQPSTIDGNALPREPLQSRLEQYQTAIHTGGIWGRANIPVQR
jgi:hypothetical protein